MSGRLEDAWRDPEKKARLLFWIWILSMIMTVFGYAVIFFTLLRH